jgi:hypothetical protein
LTAKYPGAPLDQVRRRFVTYVANLERNGEKWEVRLTEDGKLMQLVNERELAEKREAEARALREHREKEEAEVRASREHQEKEEAEAATK